MMPHRFPMEARDEDVIAWVCQACGELVSEYRDRTPCPVDWRAEIREQQAIALEAAWS